MVSAQQDESTGIGQLVRKQERHYFDWLRASVHIIAQEDKPMVLVYCTLKFRLRDIANELAISNIVFAISLIR